LKVFRGIDVTGLWRLTRETILTVVNFLFVGADMAHEDKEMVL